MTSRQKLTQAGFTLVELAIVLLIVGLLIAGILKGQELIENSRTTATVQQIKSYEAAVNTFRDSFGGLPGDLPFNIAQARLPGCLANVGCQTVTGGVVGDGIIGSAVGGTVGAAAGGLSTETEQFWLNLGLANLITGVIPNFNGATVAWGTTNPAGRLSGGFNIGYAAGANGAATAVNPAAMNGHYLSMQGSPAASASATPAISPARAGQIDLKLDDGQPGTGDVLAMGTALCTTGTTTAALYNSANSDSAVCSLGVKIMN